MNTTTRFLSGMAALLFAAVPVFAAQPVTKVDVGLSGWTGFAPLTLAKDAGIYARHGLDVNLRMIPQKDRHLALASKAIQCTATSVESWIIWQAAGIRMKQVFKMDQGMGSDGIVARPGIDKVTDLKGKTVAVSAPGTNPYFALAWILKKNGMSMRDLKIVTLEPGPAANALMTGSAGLDAAMTYEPYIGVFRQKPGAGRLIASSLEYPAVFDSFGCTPQFIESNPQAVQALVDSYFEALDMIARERTRAFTIMGASVKQTAAQFEQSQSTLKWADRAANRKFFGGELQQFNRDAAALLLEAGTIKSIPKDLDALAEPRFIGP
jgi:NitT/TauT family transport system substrate-binding protein